MKDVVDVVSETIEERRRSVEKIDTFLKLIKERAKKVLGRDTRVYVFGSYVRKRDFHPFLSDVDVLIVSPKVKRNVRKIVEIKEKIVKNDIPDIFELHLADEEIFKLYRFFCGKELKRL